MNTSSPTNRHALIGILSSLALGLLSRSSLFGETSFISHHLGDALWAALVFFIIRLLTQASLGKSALLALIFSFTIEFSQLWKPNWLESLRANPLAALVLGNQFRPSDLICYTTGILLASVISATSSSRLPK